jgi:hypothetical protein
MYDRLALEEAEGDELPGALMSRIGSVLARTGSDEKTTHSMNSPIVSPARKVSLFGGLRSGGPSRTNSFGSNRSVL